MRVVATAVVERVFEVPDKVFNAEVNARVCEALQDLPVGACLRTTVWARPEKKQ